MLPSVSGHLLDLPELRKMAKDVLVTSAVDKIAHQNSQKIVLGAKVEAEALAHTLEFEEKYDMLEKLGLAFGGYDSFYRQAQRQQRAKSLL